MAEHAYQTSKMSNAALGSKFAAAQERQTLMDYLMLAGNTVDNKHPAAGQRSWAATAKGVVTGTPDDLDALRIWREQAHAERCEAEAEMTTTDPKRLTQLTDHKHLSVRLRALSNPCTPSRTLAHWARKGEKALRLAIAGNPNTPTVALRHIWADLHTGTTRAVVNEQLALTIASNPAAPDEVLAQIIECCGHRGAHAVAGNPQAGRVALEAAVACLAEPGRRIHDKEEILIKIVRHCAADDAVLAQCWPIASNYNRINIAKCAACGPETADLILSSRSEQAQAVFLDKHADAPAEGIRKLRITTDKLAIAVACHENTPSEKLEALSRHEFDFVRENVAEHPNTDSETILMLAFDDISEVAASASRHLRMRKSNGQLTEG